jgi:hypothetical protein
VEFGQEMVDIVEFGNVTVDLVEVGHVKFDEKTSRRNFLA